MGLGRMSNQMTLSEELTWRGLANQTTYKDLSVLNGDPITFYWGVDPSADSMTVGNLAAAMMVKCFIKHGHKAVLLVGGATGLIGDPDGKTEERSLKSPEEIARNKKIIVNQYEKIFGGQNFKPVDNLDWFQDMNYLEFLRDVGKHVPLRQMMARDFVQTRLGEHGAGISYAEFSYVLIQAYDFLHLYKEKEVRLQVCGSDQWGNSIAGVDLIRRKTGGEAHVYSAPLIIDRTTGQKFGKSEAGAIWLEAARTSVYKFYQYWLSIDDESVENYLKIFTEFDKSTIEDIMTEFSANKSARNAQKKLAYAVTGLIHGENQANKQVHIAEGIARQDLNGLSDAEIATLREEIPATKSVESGSVAEALVVSGLAASNTEARRLINENAVSINGQKVAREHFEPADFRSGRLLLRRGKAFRDSALVERG